MEVLKEQRSDQNIEPPFDPSLQGPINFQDILLCDTWTYYISLPLFLCMLAEFAYPCVTMPVQDIQPIFLARIQTVVLAFDFDQHAFHLNEWSGESNTEGRRRQTGDGLPEFSTQSIVSQCKTL
jgi:hypothetical protein